MSNARGSSTRTAKAGAAATSPKPTGSPPPAKDEKPDEQPSPSEAALPATAGAAVDDEPADPLADPDPAAAAAQPKPERRVQQNVYPAAPLEAPRTVTAPLVPQFGLPSNATPVQPHPYHLGFFDDSGEEIADLSEAFDDVAAHSTVVRPNRRVYERYRIPNTNTHAEKLVFPAGATVPRHVADSVRESAQKLRDARP